MDNNGQSFIKLGWNPIYLEDATPFKDQMPDWGVKIECDGEGCNGLPCAIDPAKNKVNEMVGGSSNGAGGGAFCVVTVPKGVNANFVVFDGPTGGGTPAIGHDGSRHNADGDDGSANAENGQAAAATSTPNPTPAPSSSTAPSSTQTASSSPNSNWSDSSSSTDYSLSSLHGSSSTTAPKPMYSPHEFVENSTTSSTYAVRSAATVTSSTGQTSSITPATTGAASTAQLSITSLVMSSLIVFMTIAFSS